MAIGEGGGVIGRSEDLLGKKGRKERKGVDASVLTN